MTTLSDFKETVRQQADIVRVIGDYIQLKKAGAQNFVGLCPFHGEKTPSFSVHATRQFFHCFGCGKSGDVFKFVQEREQISFPEAVRLVAEKMGIPLPRMQYSSESEAEDAGKRGKLIEMHERACKFFEEQLRRPEGALAREYLAGRGLREETIRTFRIGFAPDSGFTLKDRLKADFSEEMMRASGLFSFKEGSEGSAAAMYSKFRNRIMFPIANENGKIIAFTGRTLAKDEKSGPKYLNSPETPIYSKSRVLYNLDRAKEAIRKLGYVILVEGQMDCIAVYSAGFHNVAASSGTAFTETQVRLLGRFSKDIVVNFDPDTAGAAATDKSLGMLLEEEFNIRVLRLEAGFDPDLFIRKNGAEAYAKALKGSAKYFDYLVERALKLFPTRSPEGKVKALNFLIPHIQHVHSRILRSELANDVAQKLGIDSSVLRRELQSAATNRSTERVNSGLNADQYQFSPPDLILVKALSSTSVLNAELGFNPRKLVLDALDAKPLHLGTYVADLVEELRKGGDDIDNPLDLIQEPRNRSLWASIVSRPHLQDRDLRPTESLVRDTLESLSHQAELIQRGRELQNKILEAERRHDDTILLQLIREKQELNAQLAMVLNSWHPASIPK
jgi:DNA primase